MHTNHSHVCGINIRFLVIKTGKRESFPRMWDQQEAQIRICHSLRIIPTYVGSTCCRGTFHARSPNHSHVCGINYPEPTRDYCYTRIIPTYVGSTSPSSYRSRSPTNHSHVCGINRVGADSGHSRYESFPRMWDQLFYNPYRDQAIRIIPTYVGSTWPSPHVWDALPNHSHVCGINNPAGTLTVRLSESFPRMWDQLPATRR